MRLNELISDFVIAVTNEEETVMQKLSRPLPFDSFSERDQFILENLIRKSLVSKVINDNQVLVVKNDWPKITERSCGSC